MKSNKKPIPAVRLLCYVNLNNMLIEKMYFNADRL